MAVRGRGSWALAGLRRIRQVTIAVSGRAARKGNDPKLVLSLEPVSADWLCAAILASLRRLSGNGELRPRFRVVRTSSWQKVQKLVDRHASSTIIVAELDHWRWQLRNYDLLYLRPGVFLLKDVFPGIVRRARTTDATGSIGSLDRLLSKYPIISLETLFYEPQKTIEYFNRWFGYQLLDPNDLPSAGQESYRRALGAILHHVEAGPFMSNSEMLSFPVGGTYATTCDGIGSLALGKGWSWPEAEHTWTDGARASLAIPVADYRGTRLCLRLDGILASGTMLVRVFAAGIVAKEIWKGEMPPREQSIALSLSPPLGTNSVLSIDLEFSSTFCPKNDGVSTDDRHLGFALRSFTITEDTLVLASLRSLIRWRSPKVTIGLSMQSLDKEFDLRGLLVTCGLSGSLITLSDVRSDHGGWLQNGRPVLFPELTPTAGLNNEEKVGGYLDRASRSFCFMGTFPQLLAELEQRRSFLDLILVSADELFRVVLDALEAVVSRTPKMLPDIAICTDDAGFVDRCYVQNPATYGRAIHRFEAVTVDPGLVSFVRRIG